MEKEMSKAETQQFQRRLNYIRERLLDIKREGEAMRAERHAIMEKLGRTPRTD